MTISPDETPADIARRIAALDDGMDPDDDGFVRFFWMLIGGALGVILLAVGIGAGSVFLIVRNGWL